MQLTKAKLPQTDGAKKATKIFEKTRKKIPSDELVKIISEVQEVESENKSIRDRAAKDAEI
jgi:hypothetical protein